MAAHSFHLSAIYWHYIVLCLETSKYNLNLSMLVALRLPVVQFVADYQLCFSNKNISTCVTEIECAIFIFI
jgi:hypothetical protein